MDFKDKIKLFFKNFFSENKGCFITLLIIFLLALFSQTVNASTSDLIDYSHTMSLIGDKEYCIGDQRICGGHPVRVHPLLCTHHVHHLCGTFHRSDCDRHQARYAHRFLRGYL